jgi:hypothetical protein
VSLQQAIGIDVVTQATPLGGAGNASAQAIWGASFAAPIVPISSPFMTERAWFSGLVVQNLDSRQPCLAQVVYDPLGLVGGPVPIFPIYLAPQGTPGAVVSLMLAPPYFGALDLGVGFGIELVAPAATATIAGASFGYYFPTA